MVSQDKRNWFKLNCKQLNLLGQSEHCHIFEGVLIKVSLYTCSALTVEQVKHMANGPFSELRL